MIPSRVEEEDLVETMELGKVDGVWECEDCKTGEYLENKRWRVIGL